ncbi:hypothetical protein JOM56_004122 [Amanita muscaria]
MLRPQLRAFHVIACQRAHRTPVVPRLLHTFSVPTRPDLYYHRIEPPTPISTSAPAFALSFLSTPPQSADANSVIGWVPALPQQGNEIGLGKFKENSKFREILHRAIREGLKEGVDEIQANSAIQLQHGWLHIHGLYERNLPPLGRIGDPDDIIASVLVENGLICAETYQPMPAYRLCTTDGVTRLTSGLAAKLQDQLQKG